MTQTFDYLYDRRQSPFLPLTRGNFGFLHTSHEAGNDVTRRNLFVAPLGHLVGVSGQLVVSDPFRGLRRRENMWTPFPPGRFAVHQTMADVGNERPVRVAYLSIVLNEASLTKRQEWQLEQIKTGLSPALGKDRFHAIEFEPPSAFLSEAESAGLDLGAVRVQTGALALADAELLENGMPEDVHEPGQGWYENIFQHGVDGSWFDAMDGEDSWRKGAANIFLPNPVHTIYGDGNVVLSQTGWGDGLYKAGMEVDDQGQPVAFHIDFQIVPFDPFQPALGR